MSGREEVSFNIRCPKCKKEGFVTYEEDSAPVYGRALTFESVSKGFKRSNQYDKHNHFGIICIECNVEVPY